MFGKPLHAIGPVPAAVHQDFDGVPHFGNGGSPGGLAGQHFQDGQLEGHFHVSGLAGRVVWMRLINRQSKTRGAKRLAMKADDDRRYSEVVWRRLADFLRACAASYSSPMRHFATREVAAGSDRSLTSTSKVKN
jgi:hypothetical protein